MTMILQSSVQLIRKSFIKMVNKIISTFFKENQGLSLVERTAQALKPELYVLTGRTLVTAVFLNGYGTPPKEKYVNVLTSQSLTGKVR